ncbi:hypothetical protein AYK20_04340 [Thermoplasmatales archaeon SG8-52-1]|nr:MAG: hypothetical protein AYK20_04340 [Thermoplasmatales archaeon SG8-52-1]
MIKKILIAGFFVSVMLLVPINSAYSNIGIQIENKPIIQSIRGNTLYVGGSGPNNYSKIQDAIEDTSDGDTVFVYDDKSPYYENIFINNSINLIGEDRYNTVIDARKMGSVVYLDSNNINISGFTIKNSSLDAWYGCGIVHIKNNNTIFNNIISNNCFGIYCWYDSFEITVCKNIIIDNEYGISLYNIRNGKIINNTIKNNIRGLILSDEHHYVTQNTFKENKYAIWSETGGNSSIIMNNIIDNNHAVFSISCNNLLFAKNNFIKNRKNLNSLAAKLSWDKNYWGKPMIFPKVLIGWEVFWIIPPDPDPYNNRPGLPGFYPYPMFDWHPARQPYDIYNPQSYGI